MMRIVNFITEIPSILKGIGFKKIAKALVVFAFANLIISRLGVFTVVAMIFVLFKMFGDKSN